MVVASLQDGRELGTMDLLVPAAQPRADGRSCSSSRIGVSTKNGLGVGRNGDGHPAANVAMYILGKG